MKAGYGIEDSRPEQASQKAEPGTAKRRAEPAGFVIMLWLEPVVGRPVSEWRWRVRAVQTGEERHFLRVADVLAYVSTHSGEPPPP